MRFRGKGRPKVLIARKPVISAGRCPGPRSRAHAPGSDPKKRLRPAPVRLPLPPSKLAAQPPVRPLAAHRKCPRSGGQDVSSTWEEVRHGAQLRGRDRGALRDRRGPGRGLDGRSGEDEVSERLGRDPSLARRSTSRISSTTTGTKSAGPRRERPLRSTSDLGVRRSLRAERRFFRSAWPPRSHTTGSKIRPVNLSLVIDKSGSMADADKLVRVKAAMQTLVSQLRPTDTLSIVLFDSEARVLLPGSEARRQG
ncbi:MAG: hypothetical protein UZ18_ATM001000062 [Armatimonadetes bacterium OLB18]|nr:MAG: hypothetical protein UZ18_ATM001000062 [Armatimonadetes bacterium OLB18]